MGRVSDIYGRRRVFMICLSIFAVGSLFCGLAPILGNSIDITFLQHIGIPVDSPGSSDPGFIAPGLVWLVAARFVQAAGGGAVVPVAMAVAGDFYGVERRGLALGLIGMVTEAGGVLGPLYGALIVQAWGWQYIFYLNVPIVAVMLFFIWRLVPARPTADISELGAINRSLPDTSKQEDIPGTHKGRIDVIGALILGASLVCLSLGLSQEAALIGPSTPTSGSAPIQNNFWLIGAALVLLAAFILFEIYIERRMERDTSRPSMPLVELSLFKRSAFSATSLVSLLVGAALIIAMADIPLFIVSVLGLQPLDSGLALLRLTAMIPVGAIIGGWLCTRITCRLTAIVGLIPAIVGFWLMHLWPLNVSWTLITISTIITGLGFGLVIAPIGTTAINAVSTRQTGMAASVVTVLRMIGMILGLAALTSWGLGRFRQLVAAFKPPTGLSFTDPAYQTLYARYITASAHDVYTGIFLAAGVLCIIAIVPALFLESRRFAQAQEASESPRLTIPTVPY